MNESLGDTGLILNDPLLWEKGKKGRNGMSIPESDVPSAPLAAELCGEGPDFPSCVPEASHNLHHRQILKVGSISLSV